MFNNYIDIFDLVFIEKCSFAISVYDSDIKTVQSRETTPLSHFRYSKINMIFILIVSFCLGEDRFMQFTVSFIPFG